MTKAWITRPESPTDIAAIRAINLGAFPTSEEADLVEALRADPAAWLPGLSWIAVAADGDRRRIRSTHPLPRRRRPRPRPGPVRRPA